MNTQHAELYVDMSNSVQLNNIINADKKLSKSHITINWDATSRFDNLENGLFPDNRDDPLYKNEICYILASQFKSVQLEQNRFLDATFYNKIQNSDNSIQYRLSKTL